MRLIKKHSKLYNLKLAFKHRFKELFWEMRYLKFKFIPTNPRIGVMRVDGRGYHGGMTDRFKGIISWWHYCQKHSLEFKIHYTYPFNLTEYLVPNDYNWYIKESKIPNSIFNTRIFYGRGENGSRLERLNTKKNIWYYGNLDLGKFLKYEPYNLPWGETFHKLFKPSELLENHLNICRKEIGGEYIAAVYRFQNLLGDFKEYHFKEISDQHEVDNLVRRALAELDAIHLENPSYRILVTSDSIRFLNEAAKKDYVYIIPGKIEHMDTEISDCDHTQLKSFLDFFMISEACKVYSITIGKMYPSDFPEYAAKLNNVPFIRRNFPCA